MKMFKAEYYFILTFSGLEENTNESLIKVLEAPEKKEAKGWQLLPGGFAGTGPNGSFFEPPAWVDKSKAPGTTSQVSLLQNYLVTVHMFYIDY